MIISLLDNVCTVQEMNKLWTWPVLSSNWIEIQRLSNLCLATKSQTLAKKQYFWWTKSGPTGPTMAHFWHSPGTLAGHWWHTHWTPMAHSISVHDHIATLLQPVLFLHIKIIQHNSELDELLVSLTEFGQTFDADYFWTNFGFFHPWSGWTTTN